MLPIPMSFAVLAACLAACAWTDLRSRRIPNVLVSPGALAALLAGYYEFGWTAGLVPALYGAGMALVLGLPLYVLRALGAGDVKLLLLVGTSIGTLGLLQVAAIAIVVSALAGVAMSLFSGKLRLLGANLHLGMLAMVTRDLGAARAVSESTAYRIPFAVAVAVAAPIWLYFFW